MDAVVGPVLTIAGIVVALGVLAKWGPLRWLTRQIITEPITEALDGRIDERISPQLADVATKLTEVDNNVKHLHDCVETVKTEQARVADELAVTQEEVRASVAIATAQVTEARDTVVGRVEELARGVDAKIVTADVLTDGADTRMRAVEDASGIPHPNDPES